METVLIPRKELFGNPDKASVQISPNGATISFLAPRDGVLNVWVAPRENMDAARPVTQDTGRGIRFYLWAYTSAHILYIQDKNGDENWRMYCVELASGEVKDLTPYEGVQAQPYMVSPKRAEEIIVGLNDRDPQWHDVYQINILSGKRTLLLENNRFLEFLVTDDNTVIGAAQMTEEGSIELYRAAPEGWVLWEAIPQEDTLTTGYAGLDKTNTRLYFK
ncbi:MAG: S9 family peptidase, partial [Anaerolineaceae bacterium]|nr:S9 family peptidase [Anaerolineaceae bacterium]